MRKQYHSVPSEWGRYGTYRDGTCKASGAVAIGCKLVYAENEYVPFASVNVVERSAYLPYPSDFSFRVSVYVLPFT